MVGQGVLRECLLDPGVEKILSIGRSQTAGHQNPYVSYAQRLSIRT